MTLHIFADKDILAVQSSFCRYGELHLFDGRSIGQVDLSEADALLVRSITQVNESVLSGTNIRFVGSATSGTDHIDLAYLQRKGINFADAKGSNANAVVDYCFAAMAYAVLYKDFEFGNCTVGIVGGGEVGGLYARKLVEMKMPVRLCDPFLADNAVAGENSDGMQYCSLEEALASDVVSLHVPLSETGPHPTNQLIGARELAFLPAHALLINACRGEVVDEAALKQVLSKRDDLVCIFDVWASEPMIDLDLANAVDIATPHIAGYSREAKSAATAQLLTAFEQHFALEPEPGGIEHQQQTVDLASLHTPNEESQFTALLAALPLPQLSDEFKIDLNAGLGKEAFDAFRQRLLSRQEFRSRLLLKSNYTQAQTEFLSILGFQLE